MVGDRRFGDSLQHFGGAIHRHVGFGLCHRLRHRFVRVRSSGSAHYRGRCLSAHLLARQHLYDAAVPRNALRQARQDADGILLAFGVRIRQPDVYTVSRRLGAEQNHGGRHDVEHRRAGSFCRHLLHLRRPESRGADRLDSGHIPHRRRPAHHLCGAGLLLGRRGRCGRVREAGTHRAAEVRHDSGQG